MILVQTAAGGPAKVPMDEIKIAKDEHGPAEHRHRQWTDRFSQHESILSDHRNYDFSFDVDTDTLAAHLSETGGRPRCARPGVAECFSVVIASIFLALLVFTLVVAWQAKMETARAADGVETLIEMLKILPP